MPTPSFAWACLSRGRHTQKGESLPLRAAWQKVKDWAVHLLHLDDSPHRIALGVAIGTFVAVTPTWGIQMLLVVGIAWLMRANKVAGVPVVWVTNPATTVPIYSFCYLVGQWLVGGPGLAEIKHILAGPVNADLGWWELAQEWGKLMLLAAWPLWVGCVVVGLAAGAIAYVIVYYTIAAYRRHRTLHHAPPPEGQAGDGAAGAPPPDGPGKTT